MLHIDEASNVGGFEVRMILSNLDSIIIEQALHFNLKVLNNEAKYKVLLIRLSLALKFEVYHLKSP